MSTHEIGDRPFPSGLHVKRDGADGGEVRRYVPERTCTIVRGDGEFPHCSACGSLDAVHDVYGPFDYCPRCGARVIKEES